MASSSSATTQHQYPTYYCGIPAPLRMSRTKANPRGRFLGCANWEKKEEKCKYFFWVDPSSREKDLEAKNIALEMKLEYMEKEKKKLKKKLVALEAKVQFYKLWCCIVIVICISMWFLTKNVVVGSVKYLP